MNHQSRDLDSVIDEVAQAMTRAELPRDLQPAIAERLAARQPSWMSVWRIAAASAAVAVVVLMAMMMRPGESPQPAHVAGSGSTRTPVASAPARAVDASASAPTVTQARAVGQPARRAVARQTIAPATPGIVEIRPLAVVPLKTDDESLGAEAPSQMVVIAPIDVEPVRISQFELVE
jgi:hypothetical protein